MTKKRIGIYGGTFAPPHIGHIKAARHFIKCARLDELLITVTWSPPHKQVRDDDDPSLRLEMAKLAFGKIKKATVSDYEIEKKGISYTRDTLRHFKKDDNELFLLVGDDMFLSLDTWKEPEVIFSLCTVVCFPREYKTELYDMIQNKKKEYKERFGARVMTPKFAPYPISSTEIRQGIKDGCDVSESLTKEVLDYVYKNGLYRT